MATPPKGPAKPAAATPRTPRKRPTGAKSAGAKSAGAKTAAPKSAAKRTTAKTTARAPVTVDTDSGRSDPHAINLALQGGGAHGAFTWGVLDWLLEHAPMKIEGISGTSAGAMNTVALAAGYHKGGPDGAREVLDNYWRAVSRAARTSPIQRTIIDRLMGNWSLDFSPGFMMLDVVSRFVSPYEFNPLNLNPLKELVEKAIDFDAVCACSDVKLFLSATNVHTGKVKVFRNKDITPDVVMASACLPLMFQAVEIDGIPYWDGGFSGNPALWPFFYETGTEDLLLIQINPIERPETPKSARDILNRMNEITFNAALLKELRAIEFVDRLVKHGTLPADRYRQIRVHVIDGGEFLNDLTASSKFNAEWNFLTFLRDAGREAAKQFVEKYGQNIGVETTVDVRRMYT